MWKSEERKKEMTTPITLPPLDEQTLTDLRRRYDETSDDETRTRMGSDRARRTGLQRCSPSTCARTQAFRSRRRPCACTYMHIITEVSCSTWMLKSMAAEQADCVGNDCG